MSDGCIAFAAPNPSKEGTGAETGTAAAGFAPKPDEPKTGFEESCWNEKGLLVLAADAPGSPSESFEVSSELVTGAEARGELLLGALELMPKNEPEPAGADACVAFAVAGADAAALVGAVFSLGSADGTAPDVGEATDLLRLPNENAGASLFWEAFEAAGVENPAKPPKPDGFAADNVCAVPVLLEKEKVKLGFCVSVGAGASFACSLSDLV